MTISRRLPDGALLPIVKALTAYQKQFDDDQARSSVRSITVDEKRRCQSRRSGAEISSTQESQILCGELVEIREHRRQ